MIFAYQQGDHFEVMFYTDSKITVEMFKLTLKTTKPKPVITALDLGKTKP